MRRQGRAENEARASRLYLRILEFRGNNFRFCFKIPRDHRGQGRRDNLNGRLPVILKTQDKHAGQAGAGLNANRPTITNKMSRLNWNPQPQAVQLQHVLNDFL
uniref:Uncharacterized protein n=1 Tax=Magallana gigas TaxID=29159 RepID=A0A8W8MIC0_MAGGI